MASRILREVRDRRVDDELEKMKARFDVLHEANVLVLITERAALSVGRIELPDEAIVFDLGVRVSAAEERAERTPSFMIGRRREVHALVLAAFEVVGLDARAARGERCIETDAVDLAEL